jgi:hypothetical protein
MTMKQLQIVKTIDPAIRLRPDVVLFQQIFITEIQSTVGTSALLPLEQHGDAGRKLGMFAVPSGPIEPVPVERAPVTLHLNMATDPGVATFV